MTPYMYVVIGWERVKETLTSITPVVPGKAGLAVREGTGGGLLTSTDWRGRRLNLRTDPVGGVGSPRVGGRGAGGLETDVDVALVGTRGGGGENIGGGLTVSTEGGGGRKEGGGREGGGGWKGGG